jgi:hypothetical protein
MSTTTPDASTSAVIDLSDLPEPIIRSIQQLVANLRTTAPAPAAARRSLRGSCSQPAPDYTAEMMKQDRLEAWANFPKDFPEASGS